MEYDLLRIEKTESGEWTGTFLVSSPNVQELLSLDRDGGELQPPPPPIDKNTRVTVPGGHVLPKLKPTENRDLL